MKKSAQLLTTIAICVTVSLCYLVTVSLCHCVTATHAQEVSLVVSPPSFQIDSKPGEIIQKTIKITNNSVGDIILRATVIDFIVQDDLGTPIKVERTTSGRYSASPWFTLDQPEFSLKAKESISLIVLVDVPKDALPGGHYAGVFIEPIIAKGMKNTVSYTSAQVGSLFDITVAGDIKFDAIIKNFFVKNQISEFGPIDFTGIVENQSDTHISVSPHIIIKDIFGRTLETLSLNETNIFPFTARTFLGQWTQIWGFGRYSATLSVPYHAGLVAEQTILFWILPYRLIVASLVLILVFLAMFILIRRRVKHVTDTRDSDIEDLKRKIVELENKQH